MTRVMRGERWAKLRRLDGVEQAVEAITQHVRNALVEQLRLRVKLEKLQRAAGYDADLAAAIAELESVGEELQQGFAIALARLPTEKRHQIDDVLREAQQ